MNRIMISAATDIDAPEDEMIESTHDQYDGPAGPRLTFNRLNATEAQIDAAIKAYFLWDDLVSALTLAGAAERVLSDVQPQDGLICVDAFSIRSLINLYVEGEHQSKAGNLFRRTYDQLRHADGDRDPFRLIEVSVAGVDFYIFMAIQAFRHVRRFITPSMGVFYVWYCARYPRHLKEDSQIKTILESAQFDPNMMPKPLFFERALSILDRSEKQ